MRLLSVLSEKSRLSQDAPIYGHIWGCKMSDMPDMWHMSARFAACRSTYGDMSGFMDISKCPVCPDSKRTFGAYPKYHTKADILTWTYRTYGHISPYIRAILSYYMGINRTYGHNLGPCILDVARPGGNRHQGRSGHYRTIELIQAKRSNRTLITQ